MKQSHKTILLWLAIGVLGLILVEGMHRREVPVEPITFSQFIQFVKDKKIDKSSVTLEGEEDFHGKFIDTFKGGKKFTAVGLTNDYYIKFLEENGITLNKKKDYRSQNCHYKEQNPPRV